MLFTHAVASLLVSVCAQPLPNGITFDDFQQRLVACDYKSIEEVLPILPEDHRRHYTLMHTSQSMQSATPSNPRAILYGDDASFVITFNGAPEQTHYTHLEIVHFRKDTKQFEFRDVEFPEHVSPDAHVRISPPNPQICLTCHGPDARPRWESYFLWPGAFGSEDDTMFRRAPPPVPYRELEGYEAFMKSRVNHPRYRVLAPYSGTTVADLPNTALSRLFNELNFEKITHDLRVPKFFPFRYALIAAAGCTDDLGRSNIDEFVPDRVKKTFSRDLPTLKEETHRIQNQGFLRKATYLKEINPAAPETPRVKKAIEDIQQFQNAHLDDFERVAALRYIVENNGVNVRAWSTDIGGGYEFNDGYFGIERLETHFARAFLHSPDDDDLIAGYQPATHWPHEKVCLALKERSLKALGGN